jgi:aspartate racemase
MNSSKPTGKIGILSGVGPLAGAYVLEEAIIHASKKYGAVEDSEYPDFVLVSHGIDGVGSEADLSSHFEREMVTGVRSLEQAGCTIIGIACNTAHMYSRSIEAAVGVEFVNIIEETALAAAETDKTYLLLTSRSSREQRLHEHYFEKYGVKYAYVDDPTQKNLDKVIGLVMAGRLAEAAQIMDMIFNSSIEAGFTAVVAGCTELPIAIKHGHSHPGLFVINSSHILAKALVERAYR